MSKTIIRNAKIVNEGTISEMDVLVSGQRIEKIDLSIDGNYQNEIDASGKMLIPGIIDDQVHFREPGLTHKADIASESRAAAAGGVTSFMEMPNTKPTATTQGRLQDKYDIAEKTSTVNYSFFMGASNENIEEVLKTDKEKVCGVKVFMGSSTGNMLVDNEETLNNIFSKVDMLIATHCEDEATIRNNNKKIIEQHGEGIDATFHPIIRNTEGCYLSSSLAVELARKHGARLHILHISTAREIELFDNHIPLLDKKITAEVCVHHLSFDSSQYPELGNKIKCNPAIKSPEDRKALLKALKDGYFDVIATDHAPHTAEEKSQAYMKAPSGLPLVQHSLTMMLDFYHRGELSMEFIISKMCHAPADLFRIRDRGYIREGYYADLVLVDPDYLWTIDKSNIAYKCGWSPLEGRTFKGKVMSTMVNGEWVYENDEFTGIKSGQRLLFNR
ncbi:MAG: dihydroorotase [Bacteroidia bacterium]|nr:dihydroorotase [Bacteroidia bacterium]